MFGKEHKNVIQSIENLKKDVLNFQPMFKMSVTHDSYGREQPMYLMNRDGFTLLAMGFTGSKAIQWKLRYIEAFNEMEERLKSGNQLTEKERLQLMLFSKNEMEVVTAYNKLVEIEKAPLIQTIEEQKPLVSFANTVANFSDSIDMNEMAKLCKKEEINIGRNRLFSILREEKILMANNNPYQKFIDNGYFELVETTKTTSYGDKLFTKTMVKGKGQIKIVELLKERVKSE